ncbi:hypothetical protein LSH36_211g03011 [Paralvinella palmiformis]|uniref:Adenosine 3'-phospho 5'-phosphosulfate transporter 2 n=1 Tax=Paralvinella palmiformis TaxID=53620 RepID=A0AAD9N4K9_9ANNE|nr:hypothetical protein LSH36_211g03011 [Paralvinella palmiformis]
MHDARNLMQITGRSPTKRDITRLDMTNSTHSSTGSTAIDISSDINQNKTKSKNYNDVVLWGISLSHLHPTSQFLVLCSGVFFFYLMYGYFQELIFRLEGFKPYGWYLTLVQFAYYTTFGLLERQVKTEDTRKIPLKAYGVLAFLTVATMGLSNYSLGFLNYPTQVIFKCCKLIPVLIGSIIIQGKKYGVIDVLACLCMSIGLICFTLADSKVSPNFSVYVTTCRKAITMILSFVFFSKPFTYQYLWSGMIVLVGIYLNVYSKNRTAWNATIYGWYRHYIQRQRDVVTSLEHIV